MPEGTYDVGHGYYDPRPNSIFEYDTGKELRVADPEEADWIVNKCRYNPIIQKEENEIEETKVNQQQV